PAWMVGIAAEGLGFIAQAAALGFGALAVVQPLLAIRVVFDLPLGVRLSSQRIPRREVAAAVLVVVGLAAFLTLARPAGGRSEAPVRDWLLVGLGSAAVCAPPAL